MLRSKANKSLQPLTPGSGGSFAARFMSVGPGLAIGVRPPRVAAILGAFALAVYGLMVSSPSFPPRTLALILACQVRRQNNGTTCGFNMTISRLDRNYFNGGFGSHRLDTLEINHDLPLPKQSKVSITILHSASGLASIN